MPDLEYEWQTIERSCCFHAFVNDDLAMSVEPRSEDDNFDWTILSYSHGSVDQGVEVTAELAALACEKHLKILAFAWTAEALKPVEIKVAKMSHEMTTDYQFSIDPGQESYSALMVSHS